MKRTIRSATKGVALAGALALALTACSGGSPSPDPGGESAAPQNVGAPSEEMESPALASLIESGELPALEERLPATPMVVEPLVSEGQYGGTLRRAQLDAGDTGILQSFASSGLLEWNWEADEQIPSLAEEFTANEDNTEYTFKLREGLKWSDGEPFTARDLQFTIEDWLGNPAMVPFPPFWFSDGDKVPETEFVDDLTFKVKFSEPFALFSKYMAHPAVSNQFIKPRHYLEQFHATYTDQATVDAAAKAAGFETWDQYFADRDNAWTNPERPVMGAYQVVSPASSSSGVAELERNPYYWKTDPSGRQLPYIDKIQVQVLAQDSIDLRASNGDLDFQGNFLGYNTTSVYQENADSRGFNVLRWQPTGSLLAMNFNLSHKDETLRELFMSKDFRAAFSQGIDREAMNQTLLGGLGVITQAGSAEGDAYYVEGSRQNNLEYNPEQANQLLDGLGLTEKDANGIRQMADGRPLQITLAYVEDTSKIPRTDAFNIAKADLAKIGIDLVLRPVDGALSGELRAGNDFDMSGTTVTESDWDLEPVWYVPTAMNSHSAPGYGAWYASGGTEGIEPPAEIKELMDLWDSLKKAPTDEERIEYGKQIMGIHDEQTYIVGLLKLPFQPVIVKDNLINVRDDQPQLSFYYGREGITKPEQLFFDETE
jgi:peptide/nickel transport system substrate-binding protein